MIKIEYRWDLEKPWRIELLDGPIEMTNDEFQEYAKTLYGEYKLFITAE